MSSHTRDTGNFILILFCIVYRIILFLLEALYIFGKILKLKSIFKRSSRFNRKIEVENVFDIYKIKKSVPSIVYTINARYHLQYYSCFIFDIGNLCLSLC